MRVHSSYPPGFGPPPPRRMRGVHYLALGVLAVAVALVVVLAVRFRAEPVVVGAESNEAPLGGAPVRFMIAPTVEPDVIREEMDPFVRWLGRTLDRPVEVMIAASYDECGESVVAGRTELAMLPPLKFVQTMARDPGLRPVAIRLYEGSRGSDGYLLVRDDKPFTKAEDLRGQTVCMVDRDSTTGFLLPRIWMRNAGLDPDKDVRTVFSGDHLAALRDLSSGRCDAAAVYSGAHISAPQQGIRVGGMRLLAVTGRVPQDVIVAARSLP